MPIYEYECHLCGHKLEKLQKISDQPLTDCPACAQPGLRKLVSAAAFRLKGGGWYETDFKDEKSRRNLAKSDEKAAASDSAAGEKKSPDSGAKTDGAAKETKADAKPADAGPAASSPAA